VTRLPIRCFLPIAMLALLGASALARAAAGYEPPPVQMARDILPPELRSGPGWKVQEKVPSDGLDTVFTIESDVGTFEARGRPELEIRVAEVRALRELRRTSRTDVFVEAVKAAGEKPVAAAKRLIAEPRQTLEKVPAGIGRFFDRVSSGVERVRDAMDREDVPDDQKAELAAAKGGETVRDALGYEQEHRLLARRLGVDPYTSNPALAEELEEVAYVAFAGRLGVNTLVSVAVPGSVLIAGTRITNDLVYDTPRGDLVVRVEEELRALGASDALIRRFQRNPHLTLSLQLGIADGLTRLPDVPGRVDVVELATTVESGSQARFVLGSVLMLADLHRKDPLASLDVSVTTVARTSGGALVVPAPVDLVSWNERVDRFSSRPDLEAPRRIVLVRGRATPRARQELAARGWEVREGAGPEAPGR